MEMQYVREDWKLFRNIDTLCQKAGVTRNKMPKLVVKELVDNALDVSNIATVRRISKTQVEITDNGAGIEHSDIPVFFSINRPLVSSKLLRLPSRGALGNGLRVVTGAVTAYKGKIFVYSKGKYFEVEPQPDGTSKAIEMGEYSGEGTKIVIDFGTQLEEDVTAWGDMAILFSQGTKYEGKSSAYWYTSESFYDLINAASGGNLSDLLFNFEGISRGVAKNLMEYFSNKPMDEMTFEDADELLGLMRQYSEQVDKKKLGHIGNLEFARDSDYRKVYDTFTLRTFRGKHNAFIPYGAEIYAMVSNDGTHSFKISVNRTPITGEVSVNYYKGNEIGVNGCGFRDYLKGEPAHMFMNIITPYMPITSDGKEPDFSHMREVIMKVAQRTMKKAKRTAQIKKTGTTETKSIVFALIHKSTAQASDYGRLPFSQRQLFYIVRPQFIQLIDKELEYNYFCRLISEYEAMYGQIDKLYRSARGMLYHPHLGAEMKLGTQEVDAYHRPSWTFNKVLYIEKDAGLFPLLQAAKFPERYDCALVTSQGHASRAVKDLFDLLGDTDEEIQFFVIHDADAAGTMIYQSLQEETIARPRRRVKIINLGLEPWEAVDMDLQVENIKRKNNSTSKLPVARYVQHRHDSWEWERWMQKHRIELSAMAAPQFVEWLEGKMNEHGVGKVIPPRSVLAQTLGQEVERRAKEIVRDEILLNAGYEDRVRELVSNLNNDVTMKSFEISEIVENRLDQRREHHWQEPVKETASEIIQAYKNGA